MRGRLVLVDEGIGQLETWEWSSGGWQLQAPAAAPGRRKDVGLAYDEQRGVTVLFGGRASSSSSPVSETWEYDGSSWQQRSSGGPTPRRNPAMAYDAARGEVVLFGGIDEQTNTLTDTWVWNGSYWREHFGIAGPPAGGRMVYDDRRSRVVLFGGSAGTWEWDGSSWMQVQPSGTPTIGTGNFAFDRRRDVAVFVGATNVNLPVETWEYLVGTAGAASWSPFGTGCAGSLGVPVLAPVASAQPTVGDSFAVAITGISPNVLVRPFGLLGGSNTSYLGTPLPLDLGFAGAPGCPLLVSPDVIVPLANSSGVATWNIAIPNSAGLLGGVFHQQGLVLEPGANMLGGITSNAGTATIGF